MSMSCSQNKMVSPRVRARRLMSSMVAKVSSGDIPAVGSSRMSSSGSFPRAMAISRIFWSPWEREPTMFFPLSDQTDALQKASGFPHGQVSGRAEEECAFPLMGQDRHLDILEDREAGENIYNLKGPADSPLADLKRGESTDVFPLEKDPSPVPPEMSGDEVE